MCESSDNPLAVNGKYAGLFQMDQDFWVSNNGLRFAPYALQATADQQRQVAYAGYLRRGWEPWTCARITGLIP